ncbi:hypothetical protein Y047_6050 [Burkholderia pseudomallei MSHR3016]|nr:hypothetical protein X948_5285 [Burkholderia pseudomallei MSHR5608]KGW37962.1 hypothetical protein Y047_6050 [Burkholderia pseudomallei MSHR3016]KGX95265.1 hypothetical protein X997_5596 [Burkholderia pseudomallei A79C]
MKPVLRGSLTCVVKQFVLAPPPSLAQPVLR